MASADSAVPADAGTRIRVDFQAPLRRRPCPLCGADDCRLFHKEHAATDSWYTHDVFSVGLCRRCSFAYSPVILSPEWLARYKDPAWNPELRAEGRASVDTYEHADLVDRPAYEVALRHLSRRRPPSASILDVGCSEGRFLVLARDKGYKVTGLEPHPLAVERARREFGLDVSCGTLQTVALEGTFDIVTLWDVPEHLDDPLASLRRIAGLLAEGGVLVLKTPNFHRWIQREAGIPEEDLRPRIYPYWGSNSWHAWDHINFFTADTLRRMLRRAGLLRRPKFLIDPHPFAEARRRGDLKTVLKLAAARWLVYLLGGMCHRLTLFAVVPR